MASPAHSTGAVGAKRRDLRPRILRHAGGVTGLIIVIIVALSAIFASGLAPASPLDMQLLDRLKPPSLQHPFGTDAFGRDVLSRVLFGGRISLIVGVLAVGLAAVVGSVLGALAGYAGGRVDQAIMRVMDALLAFPAVLLALAIVGSLGAGLFNLALAVAITSVPSFARVARAATISTKNFEYVQAARALGARNITILGKHIAMNGFGPVLVIATLQVSSAILAAASLSFLGLGIQPPTAEWGSMLAENRGHMQRAPWLVAFPGMAIMLSVVGFNLLGDALRDILDPTTRRPGS